MSPSSPLFQRRPWSIQIGPPRDYHSHTGKLLHLVDYRLLATLASYAQFCPNSENCLHYMQWAPHKDGHLTEVLEWQKTELVVSPVAANVCRTVLTHNVSKPQDVLTLLHLGSGAREPRRAGRSMECSSPACQHRLLISAPIWRFIGYTCLFLPISVILMLGSKFKLNAPCPRVKHHFLANIICFFY